MERQRKNGRGEVKNLTLNSNMYERRKLDAGKLDRPEVKFNYLFACFGCEYEYGCERMTYLRKRLEGGSNFLSIRRAKDQSI